MKQNRAAELEEYVRRILPQMGSLYCAAHAMTGNRDQAEVLLATALCEAFAQSDALSTRASLRSGVLREMKRGALAQRPGSHAEVDFEGLLTGAQEENADLPLAQAIAALPAAVQRMLVLKYGAQLPAHAIAQLLGREPEEVKGTLLRVRRRLMRSVDTQKETPVAFEQRLTREIRRCMSRTGARQASIDRVLCALEEDAGAQHAGRHWVGRAVKAILWTLLTLLLAAAAWLLAVLAAG